MIHGSWTGNPVFKKIERLPLTAEAVIASLRSSARVRGEANGSINPWM
jgi:hypothetical protein